MARRTDANQKEIVTAFRDLGASVFILSEVGKGCPDLLVGIFGLNYLVEVKDGKKPPSGQKLTEKEQIFFDLWKGQVCILKSVEDVLIFINSLHHY
jgi:hypothetical protein